MRQAPIQADRALGSQTIDVAAADGFAGLRIVEPDALAVFWMAFLAHKLDNRDSHSWPAADLAWPF